VLFRPGSNTDVTCVAHENAPAVTSSDHKPVSASFEISAGFGNVHGDIVNLATSGSDVPAFPPVEDDLRLPAQPKDVSDLRKGDVVGFNDEFLPGREAFPCVKLKPSATVTRALVAGRRVLSSYVQQGIRTLAASRRLHRCIVVVRDRVVVVDTRGRTASVHYGGGGVVKSNHHVVAFSHLSFPKRRDRGVIALHFRKGSAHTANWYEIADATLLRQAIHRSRAAFEVMSDFDVPPTPPPLPTRPVTPVEGDALLTIARLHPEGALAQEVIDAEDAVRSVADAEGAVRGEGGSRPYADFYTPFAAPPEAPARPEAADSNQHAHIAQEYIDAQRRWGDPQAHIPEGERVQLSDVHRRSTRMRSALGVF